MIEYVFGQIAEATKDDEKAELVLRLCTGGGSPEYTQTMVEKIQELADQISIKGGAMLHSAGFFFLCYIPKERVSCIDTAQALVHRATFGEYFESQVWYPGSVYEQLTVQVNEDLEKALRASADIKALEALPQLKSKGITVKDIFSLKARIEIVLTAKDLKAIGLVGKINKITPSKASIEASVDMERFNRCISAGELKMAAEATITELDKKEKTPEPVIEAEKTKTETSKKIYMTIEKLKAEHPDVYAQIKAEGHKEGVADEVDRVGSFMAFADVALEEVTKGIKEGKKLSATQMAEFSRKAMSASMLANVGEDNPKSVKTEAEKTATAKTEKQKELEKIEATIDAVLGIEAKK